MSKDKSELFLYYLKICDPNFPLPTPEFVFAKPRRWRFDWAWPDHEIAVEIEGNAWHVSGGGRHMQDSDLEKYNTAAFMGWRVMRYSPGMLKKDPYKCIMQVISTIEGDYDNADKTFQK